MIYTNIYELLVDIKQFSEKEKEFDIFAISDPGGICWRVCKDNNYDYGYLWIIYTNNLNKSIKIGDNKSQKNIHKFIRAINSYSKKYQYTYELFSKNRPKILEYMNNIPMIEKLIKLKAFW